MGVNRDRVALLVEALESGEYEQGHCVLNSDGKFCCLGVACEVAIENGLDILRIPTGNPWVTIQYDGEEAYLPVRVARWYGFPDTDPFIRDAVNVTIMVKGQEVDATTANDGMGLSFPTIAQGFRDMYLTGNAA